MVYVHASVSRAFFLSVSLCQQLSLRDSFSQKKQYF